jgi:hypothetical protein
MTETKEKNSRKLSKKEARKIAYEKLSAAFAEYRSGVKEKRFDNQLKKASKLFAADIAKAVARQRQKIQKPTKIKAVKTNVTEQENTASGAVV